MYRVVEDIAQNVALYLSSLPPTLEPKDFASNVSAHAQHTFVLFRDGIERLHAISSREPLLSLALQYSSHLARLVDYIRRSLPE